MATLRMTLMRRVGAGMEYRGGTELADYRAFVGTRDWEAQYRWVDPDTGNQGHWETIGKFRNGEDASKACVAHATSMEAC